MEPTKQYHLYTHANGFENLFRTDENFRYFLQRYEHFIPDVADTPAYCLMPNHIHLLVRVKDENELLSYFKSKYPTKDLTGLSSLVVLQFSHLFNAYSKAYNKVYNRKGSLFTRSFRRKEITDDSYFTHLIHYIHANPVHHGFVKNLGDWRWSSFGDILNDEPSLVKRKEIIDWFGNKEEFIRFHNRPVDVRHQIEMHILG